MGLKAFFILRFVLIAAISLVSHYILPAIPLPSPLQPEPVWWLITGISTILIMTSAYKQLQREPEPEPIVHRADEFSLEKPEDVNMLLAPHETSENPGIHVLSSHAVEEPSKANSPKPKTPTKRDIERLIKQRTYHGIEEGKIDIKATMQRGEDGKLKITEFESRIETPNTMEQTPKPKSPEKFKPGRIQRSRG